VLDEEGNFVGFDVVIGNPPYGVKFDQRSKKYYENIYLATDDIYTLFILHSRKIIPINPTLP
jgi:23S rRNA G2445 N2-methylase RlmL